jgi:hypothetical protein
MHPIDALWYYTVITISTLKRIYIYIERERERENQCPSRCKYPLDRISKEDRIHGKVSHPFNDRKNITLEKESPLLQIPTNLQLTTNHIDRRDIKQMALIFGTSYKLEFKCRKYQDKKSKFEQEVLGRSNRLVL